MNRAESSTEEYPTTHFDLKFGIKQHNSQTQNSQPAIEIQQQLNQLIDDTQKYIMHSYIKYKAYYDRKATAHPLAVNDYCFALHPKAADQSTKLPFTEYMWTGPYKVIKALPNNNYVIRKLNTNKTQTLHRIRLRPFPTKETLTDIIPTSTNHQPDPDIPITNDDLYAQAWDSINNDPNTNKQSLTPNSEPETLIIPFNNDNLTSQQQSNNPFNKNQRKQNLPEIFEHDELQETLPEIFGSEESPESRLKNIEQGDLPDTSLENHEQGYHQEDRPETSQHGNHTGHLQNTPHSPTSTNNSENQNNIPRGNKYHYRRNPPSNRHPDYIYYDP